ncbi:MAG: hypothetical protein ACUVRD_09315 [Bacteroidia bacterium]
MLSAQVVFLNKEIHFEEINLQKNARDEILTQARNALQGIRQKNFAPCAGDHCATYNVKKICRNNT